MASGASGFRSKNVGLGNIWRFGKQILGFGEERLGDFAVQVRVASIFVGESVEDAVLFRSPFNFVPANGPRFPLGQRLCRLQKFFSLFFFAGLRFQLCPNRDSAHMYSSSASDAWADRLVTGRIAESYKPLASQLLRYNA